MSTEATEGKSSGSNTDLATAMSDGHMMKILPMVTCGALAALPLRGYCASGAELLARQRRVLCRSGAKKAANERQQTVGQKVFSGFRSDCGKPVSDPAGEKKTTGSVSPPNPW